MNDITSFGSVAFPSQRVSFSEKMTKDWQEKSVEAICRMQGSEGLDFHMRMRTNYALVRGKINPSDFDYISSMYGNKTQGFPAQIRGYNIIAPKLELLKGEKTARIADYHVFATDYDTINRSTDKKKELITQMLQQELQEYMQEMGVDMNDQEQVQKMTPEYIQKYMSYTYKDVKEQTANMALEYLKKYCHIDDKFLDGWNDLLVGGLPVFWVGIVNGEPRMDRVNPENFFYGKSPDAKYIEDSEWARYEKWLNTSDIYDNFYDDLTEEQRKKLDEWSLGNMSQHNYTAPTIINMSETEASNPFLQQSRVLTQGNLIKVIHCVWRSKKKIGFLKYLDEQGMEQTTLIDEQYKPNKAKGESVEWIWINECWEGTKIGKDIYINVRPLPNQHTSLDNISKCFFPYIGGPYNALNTDIYSLVDIMKPLQYFYIEVMYRLQLSLARSKDKVMLMDLAQIPRSEGFDVAKWMYYLDIMGIAFVNSFEEGTGRFEGKTSPFNQFQALDLSMARIIDQYIMLLEKIKDDVGELTGITRQREGQITSSELVGTTERAVSQSSQITEPYFKHASEIEKRALTALLQVAKQAWMEGKKVQYILPDMSRQLLEVDGTEFADAEYGVFVSDSRQDTNALKAMQGLAQSAMQNGATMSEVAKTFVATSMSKLQHQLEDIEAKVAERNNAAAEAQMAHEKELQEHEDAIHQADLNIKKYEIDTKAETAIYVAELQTYMADNTVDANGNGVPDVTEVAKLALDGSKLHADIIAQKLGLVQEDKKINIEQQKMNLEKERHQLEKKGHQLEEKRLNHEKRQSQIDKTLKEKEIAVKKIAARKKPTTKK